MMRIPRLHFPSPVKDPVLAETDINLMAHPDVEKELSMHAFGALRGVGIGKEGRIKTVVRVNATKVRNASGCFFSVQWSVRGRRTSPDDIFSAPSNCGAVPEVDAVDVGGNHTSYKITWSSSSPGVDGRS
jgi:hypothetical protein